MSRVIIDDWVTPVEAAPSMSSEVEQAYRELEEELISTTISDEIISNAATYFAYVGFNADIIRAALRSLEPDVQVFGREICTLITIVLSRGTSIASKGKEKMSADSYTLFNGLCVKYKIKRLQFAKKNLSNTDVTLSRVVASHPELAFRILRCPNLERPISLEAMREAGYPDFAPGLRGSYVFSCFPMEKTIHHAGVAAGALAYMTLETNLLRKKTEPLPIRECFMNSVTYARATKQSTRFTPAKRVEWFGKMVIQQATARQWYDKLCSVFPEAKEQLSILGFTVPGNPMTR